MVAGFRIDLIFRLTYAVKFVIFGTEQCIASFNSQGDFSDGAQQSDSGCNTEQYQP